MYGPAKTSYGAPGFSSRAMSSVMITIVVLQRGRIFKEPGTACTHNRHMI